MNSADAPWGSQGALTPPEVLRWELRMEMYWLLGAPFGPEGNNLNSKNFLSVQSRLCSSVCSFFFLSIQEALSLKPPALWWCSPLTQALKRWRQGDEGFKASLRPAWVSGDLV